MSTENILQLPPEILTEIFLRLKLPDRKSVRLSCKSFFNACNRIPIISQEKFVLRSLYCLEDISKTFLHCKYKELNFECQGLPMNKTGTRLWTRCGPRIHSLTLQNCSVTGKVVKNIIMHCRNLKHWEMRWNLCDSLSSELSGIESMKPYEELIEENVIREKLETLIVHIDNNKIWASIIEKIFVIFPKLKTLGVLCCRSNVVRVLQSWESAVQLQLRSPVFAFTPIDKCRIPANVERLLIDIPSEGSWLENPSVQHLRLKEIQSSLHYTPKVLLSLATFFKYQNRLEVVCLKMTSSIDFSARAILLLILTACPKLRRLSFKYPTMTTFTLNKSEFRLLLERRLEFLELRFSVDGSHDRIMKALDTPSVNRNLHTLIIDFYNLPVLGIEDYVLANHFERMMEYFQNLKHLDLCFITDEVLQAIIKNQENLEILKLNHIDCTDFGFTGRRDNEDPSQPIYSIRRLKNLQWLDISYHGYDVKFTEVTFLEFVFPQLKRLRCDIELDEEKIGANVTKNFINIAEKAPLLEMVIMKFVDYPRVGLMPFRRPLLEFCRKLKNLYYLEIAIDEDCLKPSILEELRDSCPLLRFVAMNFAETIFYIDPLTKMILTKALNDPCIHSSGAAIDPILVQSSKDRN